MDNAGRNEYKTGQNKAKKRLVDKRHISDILG